LKAVPAATTEQPISGRLASSALQLAKKQAVNQDDQERTAERTDESSSITRPEPAGPLTGKVSLERTDHTKQHHEHQFAGGMAWQSQFDHRANAHADHDGDNQVHMILSLTTLAWASSS
jgi:hypothetical protein